MAILNYIVPAALLLVLVLTGCANSQAEPITPQLSDEATCYGSVNPNRCKLAHDKAGGYPFEVHGSER